MTKQGMRIVADANMPLLDETFGQHGDVIRVSGRDLSPEQAEDADILLVRSVTRVGPDLLSRSNVRYVGSATIGTDHLDIPWLEANDIRWASAPGCNADAAAQYSLAMMMLACQRLDRNLLNLRVGIIGRGNVGSRLQALLNALGVSSIACDPPLADMGVTGLSDMDSVLQQDIVSLHVPLTRDGAYPTIHLVNTKHLAAMPSGALLVNTARGAVVDGDALVRELQSGRLHAALDVWPGEPAISPVLLAATTVASPHVAGYSLQGRRNGTLAIYRDFLSWSGAAASAVPNSLTAGQTLTLDNGESLESVVIRASGVARDDVALRAMAVSEPIATGFDALRRDYPLRGEFGAWKISARREDLQQKLRALGFSITA